MNFLYYNLAGINSDLIDKARLHLKSALNRIVDSPVHATK